LRHKSHEPSSKTLETEKKEEKKKKYVQKEDFDREKP